jgi:hypothetical protein
VPTYGKTILLDPSRYRDAGDYLLSCMSWCCRRRKVWPGDDEGGEDQAGKEGGAGAMEEGEGKEVAENATLRHEFHKP